MIVFRFTVLCDITWHVSPEQVIPDVTCCCVQVVLCWSVLGLPESVCVCYAKVIVFFSRDIKSDLF